MKECLIDSKFYTESTNQFQSFFKTPFAFLERNGNSYLTNESGEFPSQCPEVDFVTYPYDPTFIVPTNGEFDAENNPFIVGNRVRFKDSGTWYIEQLSPNEYDEEINRTLSGETYAQLESNLLYTGIVFDDSQPDGSDGGFIYWWDTNTETLYYLENAITPIEFDPSPKVSRTQEEIEEDSSVVDLVDPFGTVIRQYEPHKIRKISLTDDKPDNRFEYEYFWEEVSTKTVLGAVPRQYRQLNNPTLSTNNLLEPCTEYQANLPDWFVRREYKQLDNQLCISSLGYNPCYEVKKFICVEGAFNIG